MDIKLSGQLCLALLLSFLEQMLVSATQEDTVFYETFDVEPGGEVKTFTAHVDGLKCEFSYACQGGTLEEWAMSINHEKDGHYTCVVERPEGHPHSYIFFEEFQLKVSGGAIREAFIYSSGDPPKPLGNDEYEIHKHHIENTDNFKHGLNGIHAVISRKKHREL
ncbi:myeloid-derived growth factor-like [Mercenaria mercenaria]|uniref:myeloid-derived growth factor-like n=1 Tax=Mercenaria mercenaria TaxID=6596 RepID=UPI001E1DF947|nr:myeloid-derived growth factor-like [Mercenaria mercenaria]